LPRKTFSLSSHTKIENDLLEELSIERWFERFLKGRQLKIVHQVRYLKLSSSKPFLVKGRTSFEITSYHSFLVTCKYLLHR